MRNVPNHLSLFGEVKTFCFTVSVLKLKHVYLLYPYYPSDIYLVSVF